MGSRGAFVDVNAGNFTFVDGGKNYMSIGMIDNVKVLVQTSGAVKAPEYSHSANRIYAIIQNGQLKHIAFYDKNHNQVKSIDLMHKHNGLIPHVHYNLKHGANDGKPLTSEDIKLIKKIKKGLKRQ